MLLVHLEQMDAPVLARGQLLEIAPVVRKEIDLLPARKVPDDVDAFLGEEHIVHPVDPAVLMFLVHHHLATGLGRDGIQLQVVLGAVHPADHQLGAVTAPEGRAEILVHFRIEVGPDGFAAVRRYEAQFHLGVRITGLGVAGLVELAVLALGRVDGEHRHLRVVETVEGDHLAVGRPPEGPVLRRAAEDLLVVNPGGVAVEDQVAAVVSVPGNVFRMDVDRVEVVLQRKGDFRGVGRPGGVDPARHHLLVGVGTDARLGRDERPAAVLQRVVVDFRAGAVAQHAFRGEAHRHRRGFDDTFRDAAEDFCVGQPGALEGALSLGGKRCQQREGYE